MSNWHFQGTRWQFTPTKQANLSVTLDKTSVHHYTPETKKDSRRWTAKGKWALKKAKTISLVGKVMATVALDACGVIFVDCPPEKRDYQRWILRWWTGRLQWHQEKRSTREQGKTQCLSPYVSCRQGQNWQTEVWTASPPTIPPRSCPCDFHLFPKLKTWFNGKKSANDSNVGNAASAYFEGMKKSVYRTSLTALEPSWKRCIELKWQLCHEINASQPGEVFSFEAQEFSINPHTLHIKWCFHYYRIA